MRHVELRENVLIYLIFFSSQGRKQASCRRGWVYNRHATKRHKKRSVIT